MIEFFHECVNYVNLPATTMMIMILVYWLMVIVGVFGMDSFDFDMDVGPDVDVDFGIDLDAGLDAEIGVDAHAGVDGAPATSFGSGSSTTGNDSFLRTVFEFFYLGEVPVVIVITFLVLFFWIATFVTNHLFNIDQSFLTSMLWLIPNVMVSTFLTRFTMIPFAIIFKKPPPENTRREEMFGIIGRVTTSEATEKFGQMEIIQNNEPEMTINVRTQPGKTLAKGDAAKIISYDNSNGTFLVELTKWEKKLDG